MKTTTSIPANGRLHSLDAVRAFALLLGIVLHATMSFQSGLAEVGWPIVDSNPSRVLDVTFYVIHVFRMATFFLIAGFFARLVRERRGTRAFVRDRLRRIALPLVVFWPVSVALCGAALAWGVYKINGGELPAGNGSDMQPAPGQGSFPLTHLWFLYILLWLYAIVLGGRALLQPLLHRKDFMSAVDALFSRLLRSGSGVLILAAPVALTLALIPDWAWWAGVPTPDQSLVPEWSSLAVYLYVFSLGWLLNRQRGLLREIGGKAPMHAVIGLIAIVVCLSLAGIESDFTPVENGNRKLVYAVVYAVALMACSLACLGAGVRVFSSERPVIRYLADASYWMYVMHMPIVMGLQAELMDVSLHWSLKFIAINTVTFAVLLLSYHTLVRGRALGRLLNGPGKGKPVVHGDQSAPVSRPLSNDSHG